MQELSSFLEAGGSPQRQNSWALRDCLGCSGRGVATWLWGRGDFGQLGLGNTQNVWKPRRVEALAGKEVVLVAGNLYNTAFLLGELPLEAWAYLRGDVQVSGMICLV